MKVRSVKLGFERDVIMAVFDEPPTSVEISEARRRGVQAVELTSRSWDRRSPSLEWLTELEPLVLFVWARKVVPPIPIAALGTVERLDIDPRTRLREPVDSGSIPRVEHLAVASSRLVGSLSQINRLQSLYLSDVKTPGMALVSGLSELTELHLEINHGPSDEFDFQCEHPPPRLRELRVMGAELGNLTGIEVLTSLEVLLISPGKKSGTGRPVDLRPLRSLSQLRDVRIVSDRNFEHLEVVEGLPSVRIARIGEWCGDRSSA